MAAECVGQDPAFMRKGVVPDYVSVEERDVRESAFRDRTCPLGIGDCLLSMEEPGPDFSGIGLLNVQVARNPEGALI